MRSRIRKQSKHKRTIAGRAAAWGGAGLVAAGSAAVTSRRIRSSMGGSAWLQAFTKTPYSQPQLAFDKGDLSQMLDCATYVQRGSDAGAVALADFMGLQRSSAQIHAQSLLVQLLRASSPTKSSRAAVRIFQRASENTSGGQLTFRLTAIEADYLAYVHGIIDYQSIALKIGDLRLLADTLGERNSQHRQASARLILASLLLRDYLQSGNKDTLTEANQQMGRALLLVAARVMIEDAQDAHFESTTIIEIAQAGVGSDLVNQTFPGRASNSKAAQAIKEASHS